MNGTPLENLWTFETKNFTIRCDALVEHDADLSWDETGEVAEKINNGTYDLFCAAVSVHMNGREVSCNYLGGCIYEDANDFVSKYRDEYFRDMVRTAVAEARVEVAQLKSIELKA